MWNDYKMKNMKKYLLTSAILILIIGTSYSQNYSPLKKGNKWTFKMQNASYTTKVLKQFYKYKGVNYFQKITKYSWGTSNTNYIRIDKYGSEIYLDPKSFTETINMPAKIELGNSWISSDKSWRYEIFKMNEVLKTPNQTFNNCMVIKAEQLTERDKDKLSVYYNYYVDGIGYVGSKNEKGLMSYLINYKLK